MSNRLILYTTASQSLPRRDGRVLPAIGSGAGSQQTELTLNASAVLLVTVGLLITVFSVFGLRHWMIHSRVSEADIAAAPPGTRSQVVIGIADGAYWAALGFGILLTLLVIFGLNYFLGIQLPEPKDQKHATTSVPIPGTTPPALQLSNQPPPSGVEFTKVDGKVKVASARPGGFRLQIRYKEGGTDKDIEVGEVNEAMIPPSSTDVTVRWFKGNEVTHFTQAVMK